MSADRQLDILATHPGWFTIPKQMPGRLTAIDFVYFIWPKNLDSSRYSVLVEVLDTAGPTYRKISPLRESVELPHVQYDWHARLGVVPDTPYLPAFEAELSRGSTYRIPEVRHNGRFQMEQLGMSRPPGL